MSNITLFFIVVGVIACVDKLFAIERWIEGGDKA